MPTGEFENEWLLKVPEMEESEHFNTGERTAEASVKKRPRKKHLYSQILQQMEFYFSDANLTRDRFLSQLLEQSKNVPLEVFLRFNKIRALTVNIEDIAKALGNSQLLRLTDDGKCVYRTCAIQKKENQDDCIIYVEQLPPDANHDWVIGIFSAYGKVEYVSIPKYKNRAAIKGFAFVEFDTPEAAKKALEAFGSVGCCLPPQMPPEELCSIATFENPNDTEDTREATTLEGEHEVQEKQKKKQKRSKQNTSKNTEVSYDANENMGYQHSQDIETEEPKSKKSKTDVDEHSVGEKHKKKKKDKDDNEDSTVENFITECETLDPNKTKRNKKRKLENENVELHGTTSSCDAEEDNDKDPQFKKKKKKKYFEENTEDVKQQHLEIEVETEGNEMQTSMGKNKKKRKQQVQDCSGDMKNEYEEMEVNEEDGCDSQLLKKKRKKKSKEQEGECGADSEPEEAEDEGTARKTKKQTDEEEEDDQADGDNEKSDKKKRARKRNKNKKKITEKKENDPTSLGLRIISKNEWRRLRNKYLNLQREKMQALKKHLSRAKFGSNYQSPYLPGENSRLEVKQERKPQNVKHEKTEYIPGVIVHVELPEPLGDVNTFKTDAKLHQGVKYVDANEGDVKVYVRCTSAEVAQKLVAEQLWENMKVLKGKAESTYWEKIWQDRKNKMDTKMRVNVRGRDKLLKHAERELGKHIKFDD